MTTLQERINQFRKMATDDPENELGHFRLGQLLMEDGQHEEALLSFARTLELTPQFSKVYQLMGECHIKLERPEQAIEVLTKGYKVADERGDRMPRDAMGALLGKFGVALPATKAAPEDDGPGTGFRCQRPGCMHTRRARPLAAPPIPDAIGERIAREICADCWKDWLSENVSVKIVNEMRLDLSSEFGQAEYDKHMKSYFGFEEDAA